MREVAFDRLLGRRIRDCDGREVGRLEEARAEERGGQWVIVDFRIGTAALLQRLSASILAVPGNVNEGWIARADQMDWKDPENPRLTCRIEELRRFSKRSVPGKGKGR